MGTKRPKAAAAAAGGGGGGRGIPIPKSFLSCSPDSGADAASAAAAAGPAPSPPAPSASDSETPAAAATAATVEAAWCSEHLVAAERFLFVPFQRHQGVLSLPQFYDAARRLHPQIRRRAAAASNNSSSSSSSSNKNRKGAAAAVDVDDDDKPQALQEQQAGNEPAAATTKPAPVLLPLQAPPPVLPDYLASLTEEERLLYQLLAAASPALYRLRRIEEPHWPRINKHNSESTAAATTKTTKTTTWGIESVRHRQHHSHRLQEFRTLLRRQRTVPRTRSDAILRAIREHREQPTSRERRAASITAARVSSCAAAPTPPKVAPLELLSSIETAAATAAAAATKIAGNNSSRTTVEERVRARAAAAAARTQHDEPPKEGGGGIATKGDRVGLVRVADALWSHARSARAAAVRFQVDHESSNQSRRVGGCGLRFKETVSVLRKTLSATSARTQGGAVSKRQVVEALRQLSREVPTWISIKSNNNDEKISEGSILRVHHTADYSAIRAQLLTGKAASSSLNGESGSKHRRVTSSARAKNGINSILHPGASQQKQQPPPKKRTIAKIDNGKREAKPKKARIGSKIEDTIESTKKPTPGATAVAKRTNTQKQRGIRSATTTTDAANDSDLSRVSRGADASAPKELF